MLWKDLFQYLLAYYTNESSLQVLAQILAFDLQYLNKVYENGSENSEHNVFTSFKSSRLICGVENIVRS